MKKLVFPPEDFSCYDLIIVGSGLTGLTIAERVTFDSDLKVLLIDARDHIGGNAYSEIDPKTNIEIHKYGSHLFHTSNLKVWEYVNRFTTFNDYRHKVKALHNGNVYSMPINLHTINQFLGTSLTPTEAENWIDSLKPTKIDKYENLEEKAISLIGEKLYNAFIKNYTEKQWQVNPRDLPPDIISRLPVRFNYNDDYFDDVYQGLPELGYTSWFENMLISPNIDLILNFDFFAIKNSIPGNLPVVYTGPIDRFFNYEFGVLGWRTIDFEIQFLDIPDFQGTSVMNYVDLDVPFTRIHEFKHFHPKKEHAKNSTIIMREFSRKAGESDLPYYPIGTDMDRSNLDKYRNLAKNQPNIYFAGRLGRYQYLDMHMAIAAALNLSDELIPVILAKNQK
jgi:UDP-galactopyranose mutase